MLLQMNFFSVSAQRLRKAQSAEGAKRVTCWPRGLEIVNFIYRRSVVAGKSYVVYATLKIKIVQAFTTAIRIVNFKHLTVSLCSGSPYCPLESEGIF